MKLDNEQQRAILMKCLGSVYLEGTTGVLMPVMADIAKLIEDVKAAEVLPEEVKQS